MKLPARHPIYLSRYRSERLAVEALEREEADLLRLAKDDKATAAQRVRIRVISCKIAAILDRVERKANPKKQDYYQSDIRILS